MYNGAPPQPDEACVYGLASACGLKGSGWAQGSPQ